MAVEPLVPVRLLRPFQLPGDLVGNMHGMASCLQGRKNVRLQ